MCDSFVLLELYFGNQYLCQATIFKSPVEEKQGGS